MYNQNWHVVSGPTETPMDIAPDTQVTNAVEIVFRMEHRPYSSPGPEIVVNVYGEYSDPNGQRDDGSWPPVVVCVQVGYEIREEDGEVNDADYEYHQEDFEYPPGPGNDYPGLTNGVMRVAREYAARGDLGWDWNGESAMHRTGGPVSYEAQ
jgi:hypothetical protein